MRFKKFAFRSAILVAVVAIAQFPAANKTGFVQLKDTGWVDVATYQAGDTVYVQVTDADLNTDPGVAESVVVEITSDMEDTGTRSSATAAIPGDTNVGDGTIAEIVTSYTALQRPG